MKHAYLIEAHDNRRQLEKLFECLDYEGNDVYLHIDAKSKKLAGIEDYNFKHSSFFIIDSIPVYWGGYSQILAEMNLLEVAVSKGMYSRYHLISGVDLPLLPQKEMHRFFDEKKDIEFVHYDYEYNDELFRRRAGLYHLLRDHVDRSQKVLCTVENISLGIQKLIGVNRLKNSDLTFGKGANWFSITDNFAKYVISQKTWIKRTFKYTKCCDEVFLQTVLLNSPFKEKRYFDEYEQRCGNLRYVDWNRGNPYVFRKQDYQQLVDSHYMFARKCDCLVDEELVDLIVQHVTCTEQSKEGVN